MRAGTEASLQLEVALEALRTAGVRAVVVARPLSRPMVEILVSRREWETSIRATDALHWRWRCGVNDGWRRVGRMVLTFDSGASVVVERALPTTPWAPWRLRRLTRALIQRSSMSDGSSPDLEGEVIVAAVAAARAGLRDDAQLSALRSLAATADADLVGDLARQVGLKPVVSVALASAAAGQTVAAGRSLPTTFADRAAELVRRRLLPRRLRVMAAGDPVGRSVVRCRFAGIEVLAGPGVFLPRAVSESLVNAAVARVGHLNEAAVVDVGTGCGAAALAIANHRPHDRILGTELDPAALVWAKRNALTLGRSNVSFVGGSLLEPLPADLVGRVDVVLANVPCVRAQDLSFQVDAPATAYAGDGSDGLGLQRELARQAREVLRPSGHLLIQLAPDQSEQFGKYLTTLGYEVEARLGDEVAVVVAARLPTELDISDAVGHQKFDEGRQSREVQGTHEIPERYDGT